MQSPGPGRGRVALIIYVPYPPPVNPFSHRLSRSWQHRVKHEAQGESRVYRTDQHQRLFLSRLLFIDSKKYYNLCFDGKEKYNSLFERVYNGVRQRGAPQGESRPPSAKRKRVECRRGEHRVYLTPWKKKACAMIRNEGTIFHLNPFLRSYRTEYSRRERFNPW